MLICPTFVPLWATEYTNGLLLSGVNRLADEPEFDPAKEGRPLALEGPHAWSRLKNQSGNDQQTRGEPAGVHSV